jgi:hypothetical protein
MITRVLSKYVMICTRKDLFFIRDGEDACVDYEQAGMIVICNKDLIRRLASTVHSILKTIVTIEKTA